MLHAKMHLAPWMDQGEMTSTEKAAFVALQSRLSYEDIVLYETLARRKLQQEVIAYQATSSGSFWDYIGLGASGVEHEMSAAMTQVSSYVDEELEAELFVRPFDIRMSIWEDDSTQLAQVSMSAVGVHYFRQVVEECTQLSYQTLDVIDTTMSLDSSLRRIVSTTECPATPRDDRAPEWKIVLRRQAEPGPDDEDHTYQISSIALEQLDRGHVVTVSLEFVRRLEPFLVMPDLDLTMSDEQFAEQVPYLACL